MALYLAKLSVYDIRKIVDSYLQYGATMKSVAELFKTTPATISNILFMAVSNKHIIDDITAEAVATKAMKFTQNKVRTRNRWQEALRIRKLPDPQDSLKEMLLEEQLYLQRIKEIPSEIRELQFKVETYEDYFSNEPDAPSKILLEFNIDKLQDELYKSQRALDKIQPEIKKLQKQLKI